MPKPASAASIPRVKRGKIRAVAQRGGKAQLDLLRVAVDAARVRRSTRAPVCCAASRSHSAASSRAVPACTSATRPIGSGRVRRSAKRGGSASGVRGSGAAPVAASSRSSSAAPKRRARGARGAGEIADVAQAKPLQRRHRLGREPQRRDRQPGDRGKICAGRRHPSP